MPLYSITTPNALNKETKEALVNLVTDAHCGIMIAPEQFVHVMFSDGIPIREDKSLYIHANVRLGRSDESIDKLCNTLIPGCASILGVSEEGIHINLLEIEAKWCIEGGFIMPSPGEEDEWMEKVTSALAQREKEMSTS